MSDVKQRTILILKKVSLDKEKSVAFSFSSRNSHEQDNGMSDVKLVQKGRKGMSTT